MLSTSTKQFIHHIPSITIADHLTVADIAVFVQLNCFAGAPESLAIMERHPDLMNWMKRVDDATKENRASQQWTGTHTIEKKTLAASTSWSLIMSPLKRL